MAETERRRRRPPVSCILCRRRKIKCNRDSPCSNCVRSKNATCVYENNPSPPRRRHLGPNQTSGTDQSHDSQGTNKSLTSIEGYSGTSRPSTVVSHPSNSLVTSLTTSTPPSQPSSQDVMSMQGRIKQLEENLSKLTQRSSQSPVPTSNSKIDTIYSSIGGTYHFHHESHLQGQTPIQTHIVVHKSRLFGQSHWISGLLVLVRMFDMIEPLIRDESSEILIGLQKCKYLGRAIKKQRVPSWPCPPTSDLPPKNVADELVDGYLRTYETIYRILHVPSFKRDYEAVWVADMPDTTFLLQLKLVLAIGATVYDEQYSMRASAIRWIYEAQSWMSEPEFKTRLSIQYLQIQILLLIAREVANIGQGLVWVSVGELLRKAMLMGLHRDPSRLPRKTPIVFASEMRRRLWNTILEMSLQSSMNSGGPPLISPEEFDTEPPGNFDDEQLMAEDPKPADCFTQTSIAIALRKTFPIRLATLKFLNSLGSHGTYEDALRLDAELRTSYRTLCRGLQGYISSIGPSQSQFELRVIDFLIHRYFLALHAPYLRAALQENKSLYAFSRKVLIESSLKVWYAVYPPSSSIVDGQSRDVTRHQELDDLMRLATCGSGMFRTSTVQASFTISTELITQLEDEDSLGLGSVPLRPDLLSILDSAQKWCLQSLKIGETNMKGYMLIRVVAARIEGLMQRVPPDQFPNFLLRVGEEAVKTSLAILEEKAGQIHTMGSTDENSETPINMFPDFGEDWDFMMPDGEFDFGNAETMNWAYNESGMQGQLLW